MADFPLFGNAASAETVGENLSTTLGTTVTASGTTNTKGSFSEITSSTPFDSQSLTVIVPDATSFNNNTQILLDIAVGAASSEEIIIENIMLSNIERDVYSVSFPIMIASGARISARIQSNVSSKAITAYCRLVQGSYMTTVGAGTITTMGANTSDSGGIQVDPGPTINTKGAWSEVVASSADEFKGLFAGFGIQGNAAQTEHTQMADIGVGSAGNEEVVVENIMIKINSIESVWQERVFMPAGIAASSRISVRSQNTNSNAIDRLIDVILYGIS